MLLCGINDCVAKEVGQVLPQEFLIQGQIEAELAVKQFG